MEPILVNLVEKRTGTWCYQSKGVGSGSFREVDQRTWGGVFGTFEGKGIRGSICGFSWEQSGDQVSKAKELLGSRLGKEAF